MTVDRLLITGGHVLDPGSGLDIDADLLLEDGHVTRVGHIPPSLAGDSCSLVDAAGMVVVPGFVDLHCHLREPGFEEKETIATGTAAAARGGFTTVCCMPNTNPPVDSPGIVRYIQEKAVEKGSVRVLPIACITQGQQGKELTDMEDLARAGVVAFSDDGRPVVDDHLMTKAMENALHLDLPIVDHCEDLSLSRDGVMNDGSLAAKLGLKGIPSAAEESVVARDIELARYTGAHFHIAHVSTAGSVSLLRRARKEGARVTAEVTPHHLTLTEQRVVGLDTSAKVNPPLRTGRDVEALLEGLSENLIEAIATDHAPHAPGDKTVHFNSAAFGISGFETALAVLLTFVCGRWLTVSSLVERLTAGPARILKAGNGSPFSPPGLIPDGLGTLQPGAPADVCVFDPSYEWLVEPSLFVSKGKHSPWAGTPLKGKVMLTVVGGKVVYRADRIRLDAVPISRESGNGDGK